MYGAHSSTGSMSRSSSIQNGLHKFLSVYFFSCFVICVFLVSFLSSGFLFYFFMFVLIFVFYLFVLTLCLIFLRKREAGWKHEVEWVGIWGGAGQNW